MKKQLAIGTIIKEAETLIGAEQVLNVLIYYNNEKKYLIGGSVYLASYENATMYTNGKSILLKINTGVTVEEYFFNGRELPYSKIFNKQKKIDAQNIYTHMINTDNTITRKFKCVKYIMAHFKEVFNFKANGKKISINSLRHDSTKVLIKPNYNTLVDGIPPVVINDKPTITDNKPVVNAANNADDKKKESAATKDKKNKTKNSRRSRIMALAHRIRKHYEAIDPIYKAEPYGDRMSFAITEVWRRINEISKNSKPILISVENKNKKNDIPVPDTKESDAAITKEDTKKGNIKQEPLKKEDIKQENTECTISKDKYSARKKSRVYVTFEIGKIKMEKYNGEIIGCFDISTMKHPMGDTYADHGLDSTKRFFRNNLLSKVTPEKVIVITKDDTIFNREDGHSYVIE